MDLKQLKGIAIVSVAAGEKLGVVDDVILDTQELRLAALRLTSGGLLHKEHQYVPISAIRSIGTDAVMVGEATAIQATPGERASGYHSLDEIGKLKVVTADGTYLGTLATVHLDPSSRQLTEFEINTGLLHTNKRIPAESVTSIGADVMVVPTL